jgi:N-acyl homoserine lactone hydrolase
MGLELIPLDLGHITNVEKSAHQYFRCFGERVDARVIVWLVVGGDYPVLIDVGPGSPDLARERFDRDYVEGPGGDVRACVAAAGVDPDEVGAVVLTHLHWDHALGLELDPFPRADVYVQREELRYAAAPYPPHGVLFDPHLVRRLLPTHAPELARLRVLDGDHRLFEGLTVLLAPGHTPGTQAVVVEESGATYLLASDNVPFAENWTGTTPADWIPSGTHVSLEEVYRTLNRYALVADVVVPSHDPVVLGWEPFASRRPASPSAG